MKKQNLFLLILLILSLNLLGCAAYAQEDEVSQRVDRAAWPTLQTTVATPTATLFPKISLADVATPTPLPPEPQALPTDQPAALPVTPALGPANDGLVPQAQIPLGTALPSPSPVPSPVTYGQITISAVNLRQGPGVDYAKLGVLPLGQTVEVLATNPRRDWVQVQSSQRTGWISLRYLELSDADQVLPVVRSNPPGQVNASSKIVSPVTQPGGEGGTAGGSTPVAQDQRQNGYATLSPVTTARISRDKAEIHPGPGPAFAPIDELTDQQESLSVLAVDSSQKWALIQSASTHTGWAALADLTTAGPVADAPQIFTAWVVSNGVEVRRGPGIFYDQTGQLAIRSLVRVFGLDDSGSWALVQPVPGGSLGWAQILFLKNVGRPWADMPHAPDLPAPVQIAAAPVEKPFVPARPVGESKIVIQRSSGGDIMVINPDGTGLRRLTSGIDPVLSPDGQTVAFTRWQGDSGSLWLINLDGSNERQIVGSIKQAKGPDWSPDGSKIVLNYQYKGRLNTKTDCVDVRKNPNPSIPRNADVPKDQNGAPRVEVRIDNDHNVEAMLCWKVPPDPHWSLRVITLADGKFEDVDGGTYAFRPAWDPVQAWRIVSDSGRGLLTADLNWDYRQNLTEEVNDGSPVFSPDGRYLVVTTGKEGSGVGYDLYRLNADGSGRVQLTQTPLWVTVQADEAKAWSNVAPAWSPDASQIIFLTNRTGRWEIWVMNAECVNLPEGCGSNQHPLFSNEVNAQLQLTYNFVDERMLSWR